MPTDKTQSTTARTVTMDVRTTRLEDRRARTATGSGSVEDYRRQTADRAIARIEDAYRRGLVIPDLR